MDKYLTYATSVHRYSTDGSSPIQVMKGYTYAANRVLACNTDGRADNSGRSAFSCLVNALYAGAKLPKLSAVQLAAGLSQRKTEFHSSETRLKFGGNPVK